MKSLILIIAYLGKDMVHRWRMHVSSPLARILVVVFLTLCALIVLANFVVSAKVVEREISRTGGNLVVVAESIPRERAVDTEYSPLMPLASEDYAGAVFNELYFSAKSGEQNYTLVEYPTSSARFFAKFPFSTNGIFLLPKTESAGSFPCEIEFGGFVFQGVTIPRADAGTLTNLWSSGAVFVPAGTFPEAKNFGFLKKYVFEAKSLDPDLLGRIEMTARSLVKLDDRSAHVQSSRVFLERLDRIRKDQLSWRVAISLGIAFIVGVLLTSISSMEFQRNEYVYALMNSFGVNRALLILSFVVENALLVFGAATVSGLVFFRCIPLILDEVFKVRGVTLMFPELESDLRLIAIALCACVAVSTVPVAIAAFRPIGRVLK